MPDVLRRLARCALAFLLLAAAACNRSSAPSPPGPPTTPPPTGGDSNTVTGTERIGWDQDLLAGSTQNEYTFSWFIDDIRSGTAAASCSSESATALSCSAPIPKLTPGRHQLKLTAIRTSDGTSLESDKSGAITVVQLGSVALTRAPGAIGGGREIAGSGEPAAPAGDAEPSSAAARIVVVARGLSAVSDLAAAGDRVIIAERRGTVRVLQHGSMSTDAALELDGFVANAPGYGLLSIAVHPDFVNDHRLYFVYTAQDRTGVVYRVARAREVNGRIGEVAVLLDGVPAGPSGWAALRFGPDGKLYAAFSAATDTSSREDSYAGHVLRLNDDGTTPTENAASTPVIAETGGTPLSLLWTDRQQLELLRATLDGRRDFRLSSTQSRVARPWAPGQQPAAAAYYHGNLLPALDGKLLVAMLDGGVAVLDGPDDASDTGRRVASEFGAARALAVADSGEVYVGTANGDLSTRAASPTYDDVLLRVTGARQ